MFAVGTAIFSLKFFPQQNEEIKTSHTSVSTKQWMNWKNNNKWNSKEAFNKIETVIPMIVLILMSRNNSQRMLENVIQFWELKYHFLLFSK